MNHDFMHAVNSPKWNRNMLNAYWIILAASLLAEAFYLVFEHPNLDEFLNHYILFPSIAIIGILLLTELANHFMKRFNEYLIIVCGAGIITTLLYVYNEIPALYNALFLPILISAFFFSTRKVLFAFGIMFLDCILLFYIQSEMGTPWSTSDVIAILFILVVGAFICIGIMHRGMELVDQLKSTMETKQELMVKNIIMDRLSKIDPLTELYNHITFHEYLDRLIEQSDAFGLPLHLSVLDIDNFKKVNDTYGHRAGDAVLKRVAAILNQSVKSNDFVARYGGEEFAILFTEKTMNECMLAMEQIRMEIEQTVNPELQNEKVTISAGLIEYSQGSGKESFFQQADQALYKAKKSGKNRIITE